VGRDSILFAAGLCGIGYETVINGAERPTLLILFGAMVGLPAFLRVDERSKPPDKPPTGQLPAKKPPVEGPGKDVDADA
jgi:hypothetical protein